MNDLYVIAEIGVNHNGNVDIAKALIENVASCGAHAVKFQVYNPKYLVTADTPTVSYQKHTTSVNNQQELLQRYYFTFDIFEELIAHTKKCNLDFIATPFDVPAINFLYPYVKYYKVSSGDFDNYHLLDALVAKEKQLILSTGMCDLDDIDATLNYLNAQMANLEANIILMHCISSYPTPFSAVNLNFVDLLRRKYQGITIGFSDHTVGINITLAAIAKGVNVIEKHVTFDKNAEGPDHKASIDFIELQNLMTGAYQIKEALGTEIKLVSTQEHENKKAVRRSVAVNKYLPKGHIVQSEDLIMLRPSTGILPKYYTTLVGKELQIEKQPFSILQWSDLGD